MSRVVAGINPVIEILRACPERVKDILLSKKREALPDDLLRLIKEKGLNIVRKERQELDRLAEATSHQGIVALLDGFPYTGLEEILTAWRKSGEKAFIVVLDSIEDPHNLGAIIRSAECAGVHGIVIPKDRACGVTTSVEKVAAGAAAHMKITRVTNIADTLIRLKEEGLWIAGAEGTAPVPLFGQDLTMDLALVIGGEGKGIRPRVQKMCDFLLSLPMKGKINSLNASASAAIVLYEIVRQRGANL